MRLRESVTAILVALGAASAFVTWTASSDDTARGDRLATIRQPASWQGPYAVGVSPGHAASAKEIVVRDSKGVPVYVSDPATATTTVMRGTAVPRLDTTNRPGRSSLERAYAAKGDRLSVAQSD